jgi:ankyrin repeat protein
LFTKKAGDLPSLWKNLGESDPSLRFVVGDRVECQAGELETNGDRKWTPCTIRHLNHVENDGTCFPYQCLLDYPVNGGRLANIPHDTTAYVRPLGFTKSITNIQNCGKCGVHESVEGVTLLNCSGCRRVRYCCIEHLHADRKNHKVFCRAIVKENKRYKLEINDIIKTGKAEAVNNAFMEATLGGNLLVIKKLFKNRGDDIDINVYSSAKLKIYTSFGSGSTALYLSSCLGHIGIITFLLQAEGIDVNKPDTARGGTPLYIASEQGHTESVKILLSAEGINVNTSDLEGATPLYMASQNNQIEIVKLLVGAEGIEINQPENKQGDTPLSTASFQGHVAIVKILLGVEGIKVNKSDENGVTPLYMASQENQIEIVKLLLGAEGIEMNQPANDGCTPLHVAKHNKHTKIVQLLTAAGATE